MRGDDVIQFELSDDTPVYVISVAAQLSGLHPQTLRTYDRLGLVSPGRAAGRGRRYSLRDILVLREVQRMSQEEGINLSGIKRILELETMEQRSRGLLAEMHAEITQLRAELESTRAVAAWPPSAARPTSRCSVETYSSPISLARFSAVLSAVRSGRDTSGLLSVSPDARGSLAS